MISSVINRYFLGLLFIINLANFVYIHGCISTNNLAYSGIRGVVVDDEGKKLSGVRITLGNSVTYSDVYGNFSFNDIKPQYYKIIAEKHGYETQFRELELPSGTVVENLIFVMPPKGNIYSINVIELTANSAIISYNTATPSFSWIMYGSNALLEKRVEVSTSTKIFHEIKITNLKPSTTYFYKIFSKDLKDRITSSDIKTFTTLAAIRPNPPSWVTVEKQNGANNLVVKWEQSSILDILGYNLYKSKSANGPFVKVNSYPLKSNSYIDTDIIAGEKYYYKVTTISSLGEESNNSIPVSYLVHGVLTSNIVWTPENNPYILLGDLWISENASLVLNAGVEVKVNSTDIEDLNIIPAENLIGIKVSGSIYINANKFNPIIFTSNDSNPRPNSWAGIFFDTNSRLNSSLIRGANINFAKYGISGEGGIPNVSDVVINYCKEYGIRSISSRSDIIINNVEISNCGVGIFVASSTQYNVKIASSTIINCIYGIVSRDNKYCEIVDNKIQFWAVSGIDVGNSGGSIVYKNLVAPSLNGSAIVTRNQDEIRRNTLQGQIGIEIRDNAKSIIRSNLILSNRARGCIGVLYNGNEPYNPLNHIIQANNIWNLLSSDRNTYLDGSGNSLTGIISPHYLDPQLAGGNPFNEFPKLNFDYRPVGSNLKGIGYAGEDIGAYDVL